MHIAQTLAAAPPIKHIIIGIHIRLFQADAFPRLNPCLQTRTVQELPIGMDEHSIRFQVFMNLLDDLQMQFNARNVMKNSKRKNNIEHVIASDDMFPIAGNQIGLHELNGEGKGFAFRLIEERQAEVESEIRTPMAAPRQSPRQFAIAAAQIQN